MRGHTSHSSLAGTFFCCCHCACSGLGMACCCSSSSCSPSSHAVTPCDTSETCWQHSTTARQAFLKWNHGSGGFRSSCSAAWRHIEGFGRALFDSYRLMQMGAMSLIRPVFASLQVFVFPYISFIQLVGLSHGGQNMIAWHECKGRCMAYCKHLQTQVLRLPQTWRCLASMSSTDRQGQAMPWSLPPQHCARNAAWCWQPCTAAAEAQ